MTHRGVNAVAENFLHTLKTELVYQHRYRTREEARLAIFDYIAAFYNRVRRHSSLGYRSPEADAKHLESTGHPRSGFPLIIVSG